MSDDLKNAVAILREKKYSFVAAKGGVTYTSFERGVSPIMKIYDLGFDVHGFAAADKVVGKGAAMIYILLGVGDVHAGVMSRAAKNTLDAAGINNSCDELVERIINRTGDGLCPIESSVIDEDDPERGIIIIKSALEKLKENGK